MLEPEVSLGKIVSFGLWTLALAMLLAAWLVWALASHEFGEMMAFTACVVTGGAATASMRCYSVRLSRIIRGTATIKRREREGSELHSIT